MKSPVPVLRGDPGMPGRAQHGARDKAARLRQDARALDAPPAVREQAGAGPCPRASVVVPTCGRPQLLARCLAALAGQTLDAADYEIVVCDDGPDEAAREAVRAARGPGRPTVRYLAVTATQGPAAARNAGWRAARAAVIAFTDDDTVPQPGWLEAGLRAMAPGVDAAAGRIVMPVPQPPTDLERDAGNLQRAEFATANCFVRAGTLRLLGGFDERYTMAWREDSDLHFALLERGAALAAAPDAVVVHPLRPAPFAAGIRMQKKVLFDTLLYKKYPRLYRQRIRPGPPWFYLLVVAALAAGVLAALAGRPVAAVGALGLWLTLTAGFFFRRLAGSALTPRNIAEVLVTSFAIPPASIFWRIVGSLRFGRGLP